MNGKEKKIDVLLGCIGEIDDELVNEALTYKRAKRRGIPIGALAACLAVAFVIAVAVPLIARFGALGHTEESPIGSLDALLLESRGGNFKTYASFDELSYVGSASLVWQYGEGGEIYSLELTDAQLARIESKMGKGESVGESSPSVKCKIWVLDGQGNVTTPYLKSGAGNVGCEIFDFEAEIMPYESFTECISDIMN